MPLPSFPPLVLRAEKGTPLTHSELDQDLKSIRSYCEMLAGIFGVALNSDGTLNPDSVTETSVLNRSITQAKLGSISVFTAKQDTGSTNSLAITITPALSGYVDEQIFFVKLANTNTGAATLNVNLMGAIPIRKRGVVDLESGDIQGGSLIVVGYFAGVFHLLSGAGSISSSSGGSSSGGFSGFQVYEPADVAIPPSAPVAASSIITGTANIADGDTVTIDSGGNQRVYRFKTIMVAAYDVQRHATLLSTSLANLKAAIDASGTPGVEYFAGTLAHPTVSGSTLTATQLTVVADAAGIGGNSIVTTETSSVLSWVGATLSGGVTDSFINFTHGFSSIPTEHYAYLINRVANLTFIQGDMVGLDEFTDSAGLPAFTISANATVVKVERHPASIEIGALGAIDATKWLLRTRASIKTGVGSTVFPAVTFAVKQPLGAMSNGGDVFFFQYGSYNGGITYIQRLSMSTNNIRLLDRDAGSTNPDYINAAPFKRSNGLNYFLFSASTGIYSIPMLEPLVDWKPTLHTNANVNSYKPVHIVESGGNIVDIYAAPSTFLFSYISTISLRKIVAATGAISAYGVDLDLTSALIKSADGTAGNVQFRKWHQAGSAAYLMHFQYNQNKKRIYVVTNEDLQLHIFKILTAADFKTWWDLAAATRAGDLQYEKTIGIPGDGALWSDSARERFYIDVDLETGAERAVIFSRYGHSSLAGSVTRIPWRE